MKRATFLLTLLLSASVSIGVTAGPRHHEAEQLKTVLQQLDLTRDQKQDIRQAFRQGKQDMRLYKEDMRQIHQQMKSHIQSDQWQPDAVASVIAQRAGLMGQLTLNRAQQKHHVWHLLSDHQQQKFFELIEDKQRIPREFGGFERLRSLDLTDEQQQQLDEITAQIDITKQEVKTNLQTMKEAERALVMADEFDQQAWQTAFNQQQVVMMEVALNLAHARHQIWNLLSDEQKSQLGESMKQHRKEHMKHSRGHKRPFI